MSPSFDKNVLLESEVFFKVACETDLHLKNAIARNLSLLIEFRESMSSSKELFIQVTDSSDPQLLLSSVVTENDYVNLRSSQGLLLDFLSFPQHLADLIQRCVEEQSTNNPRFLAVLKLKGAASGISESSSACLEIVELNVFKHLCHLSFELQSVSLQDKLQHLASCIRQLKVSLAQGKSSSAIMQQNLSGEVSRLRDRLAEKEVQVESVAYAEKELCKREVEKIANDLAVEKDKSLKAQSTFDRYLSRAKSDAESKCSKKMEEFSQKLKETSRKNEEYKSFNSKLEASMRDLKHRSSSLEKDYATLKKEFDIVRREKHNMEAEVRDGRASISRLRSDLARCNDDLRNTQAWLADAQPQLALLQQQKYVLESNLQAALEKVEKRERSAKLVFVDLQKRYDEIKKCHSYLADKEMKIESLEKHLTAAVCENEKYKETVEKKKSEVEKLQEKMNVDEILIDSLKTELKVVNEKLEKGETTMRINENMISWLNKQLNHVETTDKMLRDTPLAGAYLNPSVHKKSPLSLSREGLIRNSDSGSGLTASTPVSRTTGSVSFAAGGPLTLSAVRSPAIPPIPEEDVADIGLEDEKENMNGLPEIYLKPSRSTDRTSSVAKKTTGVGIPGKTRPRSAGLLRANSINKDANSNVTPPTGTRGVLKPLQSGKGSKFRSNV